MNCAAPHCLFISRVQWCQILRRCSAAHILEQVAVQAKPEPWNEISRPVLAKLITAGRLRDLGDGLRVEITAAGRLGLELARGRR